MAELAKFAIGDVLYDHNVFDGNDHIDEFPVVKVTASRVYVRAHHRTVILDRERLEAEGHAYSRSSYHSFYTARPLTDAQKVEQYRAARADRAADNVRSLRREMADAHPDRGGDPARFRELHDRYVAAKTRLGVGRG